LKTEECIVRNTEYLGVLRPSARELQENINKHKDEINDLAYYIMRQNHEYFKEDNTIRVLKEQIHHARGGPKAIGVILPINTNNNPFDYETYYKITNVHSISLVNSDKFSVKLRYRKTMTMINCL
jgi:hypothetical protein